MPLKFAANLNTMFKSGNLASRCRTVKELGFSAAEWIWPYDHTEEDVARVQADSGLHFVLINSYPGDMARGEIGFCAITSRREEFQSSLERSIRYAGALKCKRIHIMSGMQSPLLTDAEVEAAYLENLKYAAGVLQANGIIGTLEPINPISRPGYFLNDFDRAVKYLKAVNHPNLKLQLDLFHLQMIHGNLTNRIKELLPYVGHIQVSQAPNRDEPSAPGEINFAYVFSLLESLGYDNWIGLEYTPQSNIQEGVKWISEYGYSL